MSSVSDPSSSSLKPSSGQIREISNGQTEKRTRRAPRRQKRITFRRWTIIPLLLVPILALLLAKDIRPSPFIRPTHDDEGSRNVLLITAHPDDEVMFFAPTILALVEAGWNVRGLCLSTGNSSGLGDTRSLELEQSYAALGVESPVQIIDHPDLQDGMNVIWDPALVSEFIINDMMENEVTDVIITFDLVGITHHPNHIALPLALSYISQHNLLEKLRAPSPSESYSPPEIYYLTSPPLSTKFTGPFYAIYLRLLRFLGTYIPALVFTPEQIPELSKVEMERPNRLQLPSSDYIDVISSPREYLIALQAMRKHHSQLVWFRWLYLAFSRLMWVNELVNARVTPFNLPSSYASDLEQ